MIGNRPTRTVTDRTHQAGRRITPAAEYRHKARIKGLLLHPPSQHLHAMRSSENFQQERFLSEATYDVSHKSSAIRSMRQNAHRPTSSSPRLASHPGREDHRERPGTTSSPTALAAPAATTVSTTDHRNQDDRITQPAHLPLRGVRNRREALTSSRVLDRRIPGETPDSRSERGDLNPRKPLVEQRSSRLVIGCQNPLLPSVAIPTLSLTVERQY